MGYEESFIKVEKVHQLDNPERFRRVSDALKENGATIYAIVKVVQPLSFFEEYQEGIKEDLGVGMYLWVGGERRAPWDALYDLYKEDESYKYKWFFVSNYNRDDIQKLVRNEGPNEKYDFGKQFVDFQKAASIIKES